MRPIPDLDDRELLRRCGEGDEAAWSTLVDRYQDLVLAAALRTGLDREAAFDVLQQVWLELYRSLARIRNPQALPRWLVVAARRIAFKRAVKGEQWLDELGYDLVDPAALADDELSRLERQAQLRRQLDSLGETCRRLLTLLFLRPEPAPYREAAEELGLAVGTLGAARARCLARLRRKLEESG